MRRSPIVSRDRHRAAACLFDVEAAASRVEIAVRDRRGRGRRRVRTLRSCRELRRRGHSRPWMSRHRRSAPPVPRRDYFGERLRAREPRRAFPTQASCPGGSRSGVLARTFASSAAVLELRAQPRSHRDALPPPNSTTVCDHQFACTRDRILDVHLQPVLSQEPSVAVAHAWRTLPFRPYRPLRWARYAATSWTPGAS
jgi:hypothetical protein